MDAALLQIQFCYILRTVEFKQMLEDVHLGSHPLSQSSNVPICTHSSSNLSRQQHGSLLILVRGCGDVHWYQYAAMSYFEGFADGSTHMFGSVGHVYVPSFRPFSGC